MNNPFDYIPSGSMLKEQQRLVTHINDICAQDSSFADEISKGKMFGILRVKENPLHSPVPTIHFLYAFSGQICGSFNHPGFVPPVFDYLQVDGYFKHEESRIVDINKKIDAIVASQAFAEANDSLSRTMSLANQDITSYKENIKVEKANNPDNVSLSQFLNAELHRKKIYWRTQLSEKQAVVDEFESHIREMKFIRQHKSEQLQQWLFDNTILTNCKGEKRSIATFTPRMGLWAASGLGDCCEPKLLNYAFNHNLEPVEIGMFWWGVSPKSEVRHHLQFYPACQGRCKLILPWMIEIDCKEERKELKFSLLYIDDDIIVVNKPSGLLSVPGKGDLPSVLSMLHADFGFVLSVHRLDMDTSGVMVFARNKEAHRNLQRQFAEHTIVKHYHAILEKPLVGYGKIELPLSPDYLDRPRQLVDYENGKTAVTLYKSLGGNLVELTPLTGRTHQLRVHCAHRDGLNNPIQGDRLYASEKINSRLMLDAFSLEFTHPRTQKRLKFTL